MNLIEQVKEHLIKSGDTSDSQEFMQHFRVGQLNDMVERDIHPVDMDRWVAAEDLVGIYLDWDVSSHLVSKLYDQDIEILELV